MAQVCSWCGLPDERWLTSLAGLNTSLKPSYEPILLARKPPVGSIASNVLRYGTGALNIDGSRIVGARGSGVWGANHAGSDRERTAEIGYQGGFDPGYRTEENAAGRWPANVLISHLDDCELVGTRRVASSNAEPNREESTTHNYGWAEGGGIYKSGPRHGDADGMETVEDWRCAPGCPVATLDAQAGDRGGGFGQRGAASSIGDAQGMFNARATGETVGYGDAGGPSRFFYQPREDGTLAGCPSPNDPASTAGTTSPPPSAPDGSAADGAATSAHPAAEPSSSPFRARSTAATPTASEPPHAPGTPPTRSEPSPASRPAAPIPTPGHARAAEPSGPTDTTTTTPAPPTSDGSAGAATSSSTSPSEDPGARGSRFRYCPKASRAERAAGLAPDDERAHPTQKPVDLMRWLVTLVAPPGGIVLDPFNGSGTTGCACALTGHRYLGVERDPEYVDISRQRIAWWERRGGLSEEALDQAVAKVGAARKAHGERVAGGQLTLG